MSDNMTVLYAKRAYAGRGYADSRPTSYVLGSYIQNSKNEIGVV